MNFSASLPSRRMISGRIRLLALMNQFCTCFVVSSVFVARISVSARVGYALYLCWKSQSRKTIWSVLDLLLLVLIFPVVRPSVVPLETSFNRLEDSFPVDWRPSSVYLHAASHQPSSIWNSPSMIQKRPHTVFHFQRNSSISVELNNERDTFKGTLLVPELQQNT